MSDLDHDLPKRRVAERALGFVRDGMVLGLGSGSTATIFLDLLARRVADGMNLVCVPTSERTRAQAASLAIPLATLDDHPELDLTIDGADEFDPQLRLIKGGGGALLREKIVAAASKSMVVIADGSKAVDRLGKFPLPVEVNIFGLASTRRLIGKVSAACGLEGAIDLRMKASAEAFVTDGGHLILDCHFGSIPDPDRLAARLAEVPGVVEHGLFIGYTHAVITDDGSAARVIGRPDFLATIDEDERMQVLCRGLAAAVVFGFALSGSAFAQTPVPAAPPPAAVAPVPPLPEPEPPAGQLAAARDVVVASGMARSFIPMVPQLSEQIAPMLTRTRPDLNPDLGIVLAQLKPEFEKKTDEMIDIAAHIYARRMSEDELKQTATFFESPVGKKYVESQPLMLDELVVAMQTWTQTLSNFMMQRVRDEMIKKGHQF